MFNSLTLNQTLIHHTVVAAKAEKSAKAAKSEGGLSRGRMRNSDSGHKC